jgi:hypothetical protein
MTAIYTLAILLAFATFAAGWAWLVTLPETRRTLVATEAELAGVTRDRHRRTLELVRAHAKITSLNETLARTADSATLKRIEATHLRSELELARLAREVLEQQKKDTFAMPTIRGHNSDITSPAAAKEPAPVYEATEAFVPRMSGRAHVERIWGVVDGGEIR